jgi:hypothetical protein
VDRRSVLKNGCSVGGRGGYARVSKSDCVTGSLSRSSGRGQWTRGHSTPRSMPQKIRKENTATRLPIMCLPSRGSRPSGCENVALDSGDASGTTRLVRLAGAPATTAASCWCRERQAHNATILPMHASRSVFASSAEPKGHPIYVTNQVTMTAFSTLYVRRGISLKGGCPCPGLCTALLCLQND